MKKIFFVLFCVSFCGCAHHHIMQKTFEYKPINTDKFTLATWQKISNSNQPVHIYVEGDGHAFYTNGMPTANPTPRDSFVRDLATRDSSDNVAYIARPCQFIMGSNCDVSDWTNARFSKQVIDSLGNTIKQIANGRPVVLIGYSGGALATGLVIKQNTNINIKKWITIAGVLNHHDWTAYFGDAALDKSLDLKKLPNVPQVHYVGDKDTVVPIELSKKWIAPYEMIVIYGATHNDFPNLDIDFE